MFASTEIQTVHRHVSFKDLLEGVGDKLEIDRGETIFHPGTSSNCIYMVLSGRVKISYLDESGKKLTLRIVNAGEIFGEMCVVGEAKRRRLATAIEDCEVSSMTKQEFLHVIGKNTIGLSLFINHFASIAVSFESMLEALAFRDIEQRLAQTLIELSNDYGIETKDGTLIGMHITHNELADMVSCDRVNMTLALGRLKRSRIIDMSRYRIVIRNKDRLSKMTLS